MKTDIGDYGQDVAGRPSMPARNVPRSLTWSNPSTCTISRLNRASLANDPHLTRCARNDLGHALVAADQTPHADRTAAVSDLGLPERCAVLAPNQYDKPARVRIVGAHVQEGGRAVARGSVMCSGDAALDRRDAANQRTGPLPADGAVARQRALEFARRALGGGGRAWNCDRDRDGACDGNSFQDNSVSWWARFPRTLTGLLPSVNRLKGVRAYALS